MDYRCNLDAIREEIEDLLAVYYFHGWVAGWVGGVEKSRIELTSAKLGLG